MIGAIKIKSPLDFLMYPFIRIHETPANAQIKTEPSLNSEETKQGPRDCVLVLDYSGTMFSTDWEPSRVRAALKAALEYCKILAEHEPEAKVGIVAYGSSAILICPLTPVTKLDKIEKSISNAPDMGRTNITSGLEIALQLLSMSNRTCQVILLTDGHHNTGKHPFNMAEKIRKIAVLECIGIAGTPKTVDEPLLKGIASKYPDGRPRYRWIGDQGSLLNEFRRLAGRIVRA